MVDAASTTAARPADDGIRIVPSDARYAEAMLKLSDKLARETPFMLAGPEDTPLTLDAQREIFSRCAASPDQRIFLALDGHGVDEHSDEAVVGLVMASRRPFARVRHCFSLVLGIAQSHWGIGLGETLLARAGSWAASIGAKRLELTVVATNTRGVRLYTRCGFTKESRRRASTLINGALEDELYMAKLL